MKKWIQLIAHPSFKRLGGEAFWVAVGIGLSTIGTFAGVRLLTSVLSPEEYGRLALAISLALGLVYSIGTGGGGSLTRFFSIARQDGAAEWYDRAIHRCLIGTVVLSAGGAMVWAGFGLGLLGTTAWVFGGVLTAHTLGVALHTGARNRKTVSAHQCVMEWGRFLVAYALVLIWRADAPAVLSGFSVAVALVFLSEWAWFKKRGRPVNTHEQSGQDRMPEFLSYFWPMVIAGLFLWLQVFFDRWALKTFCSLTDVGVYFALYQISYSPMVHLSKFLSGFLGPVLYTKSGDGSDLGQVRETLVINEKVSVVVLGVVLAGFVVAWFAGEFVCGLLVDSDYSSGFWAFPWILLTGGLYAVAQQMLLSVYSGMNTRVMIPVRAVSAVLSGCFYMVGARFWGFAGVVFGGVAFVSVFLVITVLVHWIRKSGR